MSPAALSSLWPDGSFSAIRSSKPSADGISRTELLDEAFYPLTLPLTTGPGTTVIISLGLSRASYTSSTDEIVFVLARLAAAVAIAITIFLCFAYADRVQLLLGHRRAAVGVYSVLPRYPDSLVWQE